MLSYGALFLSALMAASFLPMQSEAVLIGLLVARQKSVASLIVIATLCNVLGAVVNWVLGRALRRFAGVLGFQLHKSKCSVRRDGICAMGDGLCWEAGCRL